MDMSHIIYHGDKEMEPKPIEAILKERGKKYGDFGSNAIVAQQLKYVLSDNVRSNPIPSDQREALDLIFTKISRIVTGDWSYIDNWDDIAGYATLIANRLRENNASITQAPK